MYYIVKFYKNSYFFGEEKEIKVKAKTSENALKNARRKGYLLKNGWQWSCIIPINEA